MSCTEMEVKGFQPNFVKLWNLFSLSHAHDSNPFSVDSLMEAAIKRSGVSDYGCMDFHEGLKAFVASLNQNKGYHSFGRFYIRQMIIAMLVHRLRHEQLLKQHPEIHHENIARPLFILGLPRSGTTLLFNLLALDPRHRFMSNWEAFIAQVPPKGRYTYENDPRRKQARWMLRFQKYLMPDIDTLHFFAAEKPEECTPILMQSFATQAFAGSFNVPDFSSWLDHADHGSTYRHHKKVLQALQWKYPGERWLLKSPDHLSAIDVILKSYPDACFVHIHRDPVKSVSSWASLNLVYRGVCYPYIDTSELGQQVLTRLANDVNRYIEQRPESSNKQFYDLAYNQFLEDPIDSIGRIYEKFGFVLTKETVDNMNKFLSKNPQNKHGVHHYKAEDFGLTKQTICQRFEEYIDTFKVQYD